MFKGLDKYFSFYKKTTFLNIKADDILDTSSCLKDLDIFERRKKYLTQNHTQDKIVLAAAINGDNLVLDILIDPVPQALYQLEAAKKLELYEYNNHKDLLERKRTIFSSQIKILAEAYATYKDEVVNYVEVIEEQISEDMQNLLYQFRLEHRKMLIQSSEINLKGQLASLDHKLRTQLHKEFSEQLEVEFKNCIVSLKDLSLETGILLYKQLVTQVFNIGVELKNLPSNSKYKAIFEVLTKFNTDKEVAKSLQEKKRKALLSALLELEFSYRTHTFSKTKVLSEPKHISINYTDSRGNTLLHHALQNGHFQTALFLLLRNIDFKIANNKGILGIDAQNKEGNTLLHHLASVGEYEVICNLICNGANCNLVNSQHAQIFDVFYKGSTFLHYLIRKISSTQSDYYFGVFLHIIENGLTLSHLLIEDDKLVTPFLLIQNLSDESFKECILGKIKSIHVMNDSKSENDSAGSEFQRAVSQTMWQHLLNVPNPNTGPWVVKFYKTFTKDKITKQYQFLNSLQKTLIAAKSTSDMHLWTFLSTTLHNYKPTLPKTLYDSYRRKAEIYNEKRDLKAVDKQSRNDKKVAKECSNAKPAIKKAEHQKSKMVFCVDPIGWFKKPKSTVKAIEYVHRETPLKILN